jgi:protein-L-isoaspartate(D-aspartate) O-methyltransferase
VPGTIWTQPEAGGWYVPVRRETNPAGWEALVAADEPVVTQVEWFEFADGVRRPGHVTSSSSAPWLMSRMLDALGIEPGMRVLEIGTGTGWNAALMAAAGAVVTTVEIDAEVAEHARSALANAGFGGVVVVCEDGELGAPAHAPYDRVIATAAAHTVPYPWVGQTVEGGVLVVPYAGRYHRRGLVVLTVSGGVARGTIVDDNASFMPLRGQVLPPAELERLGEPEPGTVIQIEVGPEGQRVTAERLRNLAGA